MRTSFKKGIAFAMSAMMALQCVPVTQVLAAENDDTITNVTKQTKSYQFVWNDNNNEGNTRTDTDAFEGALYYSLDGGSTYVRPADNEAFWHELMGGETALPALNYIVESSNFNVWKYSAELPVSYTQDGQTKNITWTVNTAVVENQVSAEYLITYDDSNGILKMTEKEDFDATIVWEDNGNNYTTRPTLVSSDFEVYQYLASNREQATLIPDAQISLVQVPGDVNEYTLSIVDQPSYNDDGYDYNYYIKLKNDAIGATNNADLYSALYENFVNNASEITEIYSDGIMTLTLEGETQITVNKIWFDDNNTERPNSKLYLYRVVEKDDGTVDEEQVKQASPVQNFDTAEVPTNANSNDVITITFVNGTETFVPKYDLNGHRYVYFALETGLTGDYVHVIDNTNSTYSSEVKDAFENSDLAKYVLAGGTITNTTEAAIQLNGTKIFRAVAMQNMTALVEMTLQVKDAQGNWVNATQDYLDHPSADTIVAWVDSNGNIVMTLDGFCSESTGDQKDGPDVVKYDPVTKIKNVYRWIETAIQVENSDKVAVEIEDDAGALPVYKEANLQLNAPGIENEKTTARFQPVQRDNGTVENILVGDTQVVIDKYWYANGENISGMTSYTYTDEEGTHTIDMTSQSATFTIYRDGAALTDVDAQGNAISPVVLTAADLKDSTVWEKVIAELPRYDSNGREYKYTVKENPADGWGMEENVEYSIVNDGIYDITQIKYKYVNTIGPSIVLEFELYKDWLDDSDLLTRQPVEVGVYRLIKDADGNITGCEATPAVTTTLSTLNGWYDRVYVTLTGEMVDDTVADYIVKEISVGTVPVTQIVNDADLKAQEVPTAAQLADESLYYGDDRIVGNVDEGEDFENIHYVYDVFVTRTAASNDGRTADYHVANRRVGVMNVEMRKSWVAGSVSLSELTGTFELRRTDFDGNTVLVKEFNLPDVSSDAEIEIIAQSGGSYVIIFKNLPKYDHLGQQYEYTIVETKIGGQTLVEQNGTRVASVQGDRYVSKVYESSRTIIGKVGHHTGDTYRWVATNTRVDSDRITVYKVWRDDGTAKNLTARPDVYFQLKRFSIDDETYNAIKNGTSAEYADFAAYYMANKDAVNVVSLGGERFWNTKWNDWCWSCDIGTWAMFDSDGYHYIYFIEEGYQKGSGEYVKYYDNQVGSNVGPNTSSTVTGTKDVLAIPESNMVQTVLVVADGSDDTYANTVVNTRKGTRTISGKKIWNLPTGWSLPASEMPSIKVTLYVSDSELDYTTHDEFETLLDASNSSLTYVNEKDLAKGATTFLFTEDYNHNALAKYNDYGETVYYYVDESSNDPNANFSNEIVMVGTNNFSIRNTYEFLPPYVDLEITKTWSNTRGLNTEDLAPAKFEIYAQAQDEGGNPVGSENLMATVIVREGTSSIHVTKFTQNVNCNPDTNSSYNPDSYQNLPYTAANGRPYIYYVKEVSVPNGYTATINGVGGQFADPIVLTQEDNDPNDDKEPYDGSVSFSDTYTGGDRSITAAKSWADGSSITSVAAENAAYRPSELTLSIRRSWTAKTVNGKTMPGGDEAVGTYTVDSSNDWKVTVSGLARYAPSGAGYTYYVDSETYPISYTADKQALYTTTKSGTTITNTLARVDMSATKTWVNGETNAALTQAQINDIYKLGALPDTMSFTLERSADGTAWTELATKTVSHGAFATASASWTGLPKYTSDAATEYQYRVVEKIGNITLITGNSSVEPGSSTGTLTQIDPNGTYRGDVPSVTTSWNTNGTTYTSAFTNTIDFTYYTLVKEWDDGSNFDNTRPNSVTINLRNGSSTETANVVVNKPSGEAGDTWTKTQVALPTPADGQTAAQVYSATDSVAGYNASAGVWNAAGDTLTVRNTLDPNTPRKTVNFTATKNFAGDTDWIALTRPVVKLELNYLAQGTTNQWVKVTDANKVDIGLTGDPVQSVSITGNSGTASWTGLYRYWSVPSSAGVPELISYKVTEVMGYLDDEGNFVELSAGNAPYTVTYGTNPTPSGSTSTNYTQTVTNTMKTTSVTVTKSWNDDGNRDGLRPSNINVNLLANGTVEKTASLSGTGWTYTFSNLPIYNSEGENLVYTVTEPTVPEGYEMIGPTGSAADGYTITNKHDPAMVNINGTKTWTDGDNQDGIRPDEITVYLLANGDVVDQITVGEEENWSWSFSNYKYKNGEELTYSVSENSIDGYAPTVTGYSIENAHIPETIDLTGSKTWNDADNQDGIRPDEITVYLLANGDVVDQKTVGEQDGWSWTFADKPKYENGAEITYTVSEDPVDGYDAIVTGCSIKNVHEPETIDVAGTKNWNDDDNRDNLRPDEITIRLYADDVEIDSTVVTEQDNWSWTFTGLEKFKAGEEGQEVVYTISEDEVDEYTTKVDGYSVTNTHEIYTTEITGTKTWNDADDQDGKRPESITIRLLANGVEVEVKEVTADDDWAYEFTDIPLLDQGEEIVYTLTEDAVSDYSTEVNGYDITNTHTPGKTSVTVTKTWADGNDADGIRPKTVTVTLIANGEKTKQAVTLNKENNWSAAFSELDEYANGEKVVYTVEENEVKGYTAEVTGDAVTGYVITNSHTTKVKPPSTGDQAAPLVWACAGTVAAGMLLCLSRRKPVKGRREK